ncbi:MAG TPA: acyl-CoA dehydrogenase family protein [Chitinophagales bacterium]|jgi:alkylation response protein AidB-like acyl-CoA dehydrogenase|nr:acyl-CoA dehydrogenase family protein [Chitinophagales bacterium]HQO31275.1 acyl-CoA dehydrogenase family protein [Chitinophagales bacterium]HQO88998.1 acyl-CoA dehydrogenase family protein [Chitinophagales bacterium]
METLDQVKSLKGGEFVIKESTPQQVFTPEDYTEEQMMVRSMASDFIEKEVMPRWKEIEKQEPGLSLSLLGKAGELGLLSTAIPEAYGGMNQDVISGCIIAEEVGRSGSFATTLICHIGIGTLPILYFGTEEQKQKFLPKLGSGEWAASYCLTEPSSGSDALGAKTTATLSEDGKEWILNGQKMWITNAGFAHSFTVFAKIDGKEFTAFLVEAGTPGLNLGAEEDKMGIKGSSTRQVFFENCRIPVENMLGERGKGHLIAFNILNIGRYKLGATALGGARQAFNMAVQYANERTQFGKSLSSFGAIQHKIAEMAIQLFALEVTTYRCANDIGKLEHENLEAGMEFSKALLGAAEEYAIECAIVKVLGSEVLDFIVDENVQIHGGMGFSEETNAARAYRDSRIARIYEGTSEINRLLSIDMLLKRAMGGKIDLMTPGMAIQKELMSVPDFGDDDEGQFAAEIKAIKNAKKAFLLVAGGAVQKLMAKLKDEQEIIMNASDMLIQIYTAESLLLRVQKIFEKGEKAEQVYIDILKVAFNDAMNKINVAGKDALQSYAEGDELRIMLMGLKRFTKYEPVNVKDARRRIAAKVIEAGKYNL